MKNEIIEMKLMPAMNIDETVAAFKEYQSLKKKLEGKGDFIKFGTGKGEKEAPTKQWRVKLNRYFGLCAEITKEWDTQENDNTTTYHKRARVTHLKSGLFYEATGACNTGEKERDGAKKYHNAESHAETRAKNRVVFEFVGFGEVSAEELTGSHDNNHSQSPIQKSNTAFATMPQVNLIKTQIVGSHLFDIDKHVKDKSIVDLLENGMTKTKASEIIDWWRSDTKKSIIGEREKREKAEKEATPKATKADRTEAARGIVNGKVELKEGHTGLLEEEEEPGSSYNNSVPYKGKKKALKKVSKAEDFVNESDYISPEDLPD